MLHKTRVAIRLFSRQETPQTTRNVCVGMPEVRIDGRTVGRSGGRSVYGQVIAKFSRMGSLPHCLTNGASLRAFSPRELR